MFLKKEWLGGLVLLFILGCEQSSDTVINIPNLQLECSLSDSGLCSSGNPQTVTGFVRLSRSGCGDSLSYDPVATGSVLMNCDAAGCDGVVSAWTDPETNMSVNEILTGRMDICSQVDLNNSSGLPDSGDLVNEDSQTITTDEAITVDSWSVQ